ncbi:CBS domain-containing protein CBSCBSPB3-like [Iris pallida]|uniref:CBS domain-containing protein CBSCBSPB3-like n=1 Tax=Iris pallida TaxID=29817 RepID=A0AAX6HT35_IRIPA|nr:CBS domain-containing protein CBSCBSPB3-like [Iris pallida]
MSTNVVPPPRRMSRRYTPFAMNPSSFVPEKSAAKPPSPNQTPQERTIKKLRLSKAMAIPRGPRCPKPAGEWRRRSRRRPPDRRQQTDSSWELSPIRMFRLGL